MKTNKDQFTSKPFAWAKDTNKDDYIKMKLVVKNYSTTNSLLFDLETESLKIIESRDIIFSEDEYNLIKSVSELT